MVFLNRLISKNLRPESWETVKLESLKKWMPATGKKIKIDPIL